MAATPRLNLPFLDVGQAQKEFTHNESLQTLDALVAGAVEEPPAMTVPTSPAIGDSYIVAEGATDAWAGKAQFVATWTSGGWRFVAPVEGMSFYERSSGTFAVFSGGSWEIGIVHAASVLIGGVQVVGPRAAAIESPTGGSVVDGESRAAIEAILATLRLHGLIDA